MWRRPKAKEKRCADSLLFLLPLPAGRCWEAPLVAQETNACLLVPATKLEAFDTNTDTVIIKATAPIGTVPAHGGAVSVRCREITDAGTGRRESGIIIDITFGRPVGGHDAD